jgi:hypothetical protein
MRMWLAKYLKWQSTFFSVVANEMDIWLWWYPSRDQSISRMMIQDELDDRLWGIVCLLTGHASGYIGLECSVVSTSSCPQHQWHHNIMACWNLQISYPIDNSSKFPNLKYIAWRYLPRNLCLDTAMQCMCMFNSEQMILALGTGWYWLVSSGVGIGQYQVWHRDNAWQFHHNNQAAVGPHWALI